MRTNNKFGYGGMTFMIMLYLINVNTYSQTCTINGSGTISWNNASPPSCIEGGDANDPGITIIDIPSSVNLDFNSNSDTWTGTSIYVSGTLSISAPGQVTINSSIIVRNGGLLSIGSKLNLGPSSTGCGYSVIAENGSTLDIVSGAGASDRLSICGVVVAQGGGGCNPYPSGPLPYCEPTGGFPTPLGFDENGDNPLLLPVTLLFFKASSFEQGIKLSWKTATELNNDFFTIERSENGVEYHILGTVLGSGTTNDPQEYSFIDRQPISGTSYYRLKQTDYDGTTETFRPVSVFFENTSEQVIFFPNPVTNGFLNISISDLSPESNLSIHIYDLNSRCVFSKLAETNRWGSLHEQLNISEILKGSYIIELKSQSKSGYFKLIKL